jgi:hypothetical protein
MWHLNDEYTCMSQGQIFLVKPIATLGVGIREKIIFIYNSYRSSKYNTYNNKNTLF